MTGQELMDDLRLAQLLPLSTVVVMISSDANYSRVAEAAEAAVDAYLIKPHTEEALRQRLLQARQRKRELRDLIALAEQGEFDQAASLAESRVSVRGPNWLQAARIGAELWLRVGRPTAAQRLMEAILEAGALPWARLGLARAQYEAGGVFQARRTLESLIAEQPTYTDAYDVMGRVLLEQGEPDSALEALRRATALTPNAVTRLVKLGLLAFSYGDASEAHDALHRAARLGMNSRTYDLQGLVLLAALQFDRGEPRALATSLRMLSRVRSDQPRSPRLRRFEESVSILAALVDRRIADAVTTLLDLFSEAGEPDFDFEAACNLLMVTARVSRSELNIDDLPYLVRSVASRFASSRTTSELLCRALVGQPQLEARVRECYAEVGNVAEAAVSHSVRGQPAEAVTMLLDAAQRCPNAKYIDLALHTTERHRASIVDADILLQRANALHRRYRSYGTQVRIGQLERVSPPC